MTTNEEYIDKEKMKIITGVGCVYVEDTIYKLVVTDKDNNPIDLCPILNKLASKILEDTTSKKKNIISSIIRSLATYGIKPANLAATFSRKYLDDFEDRVKELIVVSPLWETSSASFMLGYLTAMFINKHDIRLRAEAVNFNKAEKAAARRLNSATILVESLIYQGLDIVSAYAVAVVKDVITEEDLEIVVQEEHRSKVLEAIEQMRKADVVQQEKELKN